MILEVAQLDRVVSPIHSMVDAKADGVYGMIRLTTDPGSNTIQVQGGNQLCQILGWMESEDGEQDEFDVYVSEAQFHNCLQNFKDQVTIRLKNTSLELRSGRSRTRLATASTEFASPRPVWDSDHASVFIDKERYRDMLRRTLFAVARKADSRNVPPGPVIDIRQNESMTLMATDAFRVSLYEMMLPTEHPNVVAVLPVKILQVMEREIRHVEGIWLQIPRVHGEPTSIFFNTGQMILSAALYADIPPDMRGVSRPLQGAFSCTVDRDSLVRAIRSAEAVLGKEGKEALMHLEPGSLTVQAQSSREGVSSSTIDCEYVGPVTTIGVDPQQLREVLDRLDNDIVELEIPPSDGAWIRISEGSNVMIVGLHEVSYNYDPELGE